MPFDPGTFLEAIGAALSEDGQVAELRLVRKNGTADHVRFPAAAAASVMLNIEQAIGTLFEKQRAMLAGQDPRTFFAIGAKHVVAIQGAVAQGAPVVSFVLKSGVRMDFRLEQEAIRDLISWLQELEAVSQKPPAARN
jgi:hypothetical protein